MNFFFRMSQSSVRVFFLSCLLELLFQGSEFFPDLGDLRLLVWPNGVDLGLWLFSAESFHTNADDQVAHWLELLVHCSL